MSLLHSILVLCYKEFYICKIWVQVFNRQALTADKSDPGRVGVSWCVGDGRPCSTDKRNFTGVKFRKPENQHEQSQIGQFCAGHGAVE